MVPEVAVLVAEVGVSGEVPSTVDIRALPLVGQVSATGRTLDREAADLAVRHGRPIGPEDRGDVSGHGPTGRARPDVVVRGGDEDVQHLGGPDPVDDLQPGGLVKGLPHRARQRLAGGDAAPQGGQLRGLAGGEHRPVGHRRGGQHGDLVRGDQVGEFVRGGPLDEQRRRADPQREDDEGAEAEGEGQRRRTGEDVVRGRAQHVPGKRVGHGEHVPVEVHGRLGAARRTGGEREHRDVVGRGLHGGKGVVPAGRAHAEVVGVAAVVHAIVEGAQPGDTGGVQVGAEPSVAQGELHLRDLTDDLEFTGSQQRHGRDSNTAGEQYAEPACGQPRGVGATQQHPVAGHQPQVVHQDGGDPVRGAAYLGVRPGLRRRQQARAVRSVLGDGVVQQRDRCVQPARVLQLGQVEGQIRPLVARRQVVAAE